MYQQQPPHNPYNPYNPYAQPYGAPFMPPRRSGIPKVIGILMIIFGSLGLIGGLIGIAMAGIRQQDADILATSAPELLESLKHAEKFDYIFITLGIPVSLFQLIVGTICVKYRPKAPALALVYAMLTSLLAIIRTVVLFAIVKPEINKAAEVSGPAGRAAKEVMDAALSIGAVFGLFIVLAWAIVVMILMTRPAAKEACAATAAA